VRLRATPSSACLNWNRSVSRVYRQLTSVWYGTSSSVAATFRLRYVSLRRTSSRISSVVRSFALAALDFALDSLFPALAGSGESVGGGRLIGSLRNGRATDSVAEFYVWLSSI
jgi:hypothetical protein